MNNNYKISSIVLIIVLSFFAVQASLQEADISGDTGATMDIVEPQDGVSLDDGQSSLKGVENFGLSVGEAGQDISLELGEPETPVLLDSGVDTGSFVADAPQDDIPSVILNEVKDPIDYKGGDNAKDYWLYVRTYDKPEVSLGETGGRSKKGDIVQILDASVYPNPSETEKKEWLIIKVSGLTQNQIDIMMQPWTEEEQIYDKIEEETKAYRKYKVDIDDLKNQEGINITEGLWQEEIDKTNVINQIEQKNNKDISRYYWQSVRYSLVKNATGIKRKIAGVFVPRARAATTVTKIVITTGGGDYASLSLWEDANDGDISAATGSDTIQVVNCSGATADGTAVVILGWTTAVGNYIDINGNNTSGVYNTNAYRLELAGNPVINVDAIDVKIDSLQITNTATVNYRDGINIGYAGINADISNCILVGNVSYQGYGINSDLSGAIGTIRIWNNIIYNWARGGIDANIYHWTAGTLVIYNNTIFNCAGDGGIISRNNDTDVALYLKNNIVQGTTDYSLVNGTGVTFVSADNIAGDTNSPNNEWDSKNVVFVNETAGTENLHLDSTDTSGAIDGGTDLSTDSNGQLSFSTDIDGNTRSGTWDIGADEYIYHPRPPASGTGTGPAMY